MEGEIVVGFLTDWFFQRWNELKPPPADLEKSLQEIFLAASSAS